MVNSNYSQVQK